MSIKPDIAASLSSSLPAISPDIAEEQLGDEIDNIIPSRGYELLPVVGLGGSAGSITALQHFFKTLPADSGMAYVVILHLSPEWESTLAQVLQQSTGMPVAQAQDGQRVEADHVYVIPPGKHLTLADGHIRLTNLSPERGRRVAVDLFFRTLADTHGPHSSAIVFSGADGDGAIGIKRIKERGGLTIAQDPTEAEYDGMPRAAIETGMVDWVLPVAEIPRRLLDYQQIESRLKLPPEQGPQVTIESPAPNASEKDLRDVLTFVRTRTARDFSYYKRATILRRISRRMQVNGVTELGGYLAFLRAHPGEATALLQELLISVTNFFRDRDAFAQLEKIIPDLFAGKSANDTVRVWVAACATGEEAYSIAMLLHEHADKIETPPAIQIFATDLDERVIQTGRDGIYPEAITADVSEERLKRFFTRGNRGYRVRGQLRESILFALHDLLKDSPFSRLDLITCRNLLIYLNADAQTRACSIFHFALRPEGRLFLGASESVDEASPLFSVLDKKARLYASRPVPRLALPAALGPAGLESIQSARERLVEKAMPSAGAAPISAGDRPVEPSGHHVASWAELHFKMLEFFAPPSVIVDKDYEIMHLSENAKNFLEFTGGEPTRNLLRVVHPMLRIELRAALYRAAQTRNITEIPDVPVEIGGERQAVDLRVSPAGKIAPDFLLVSFNAHQPRGHDTEVIPSRPENITRQLEQELVGTKAQLRDIVEQYEASTEELKASNEELQAMNEELRSATEELETGREELQSINEELITVNLELKTSVDKLAHSNSDLQNLMASTAIATVFLDRDLRITRFTPTAVEIFNLILTDIGRPLTDLAHRLDYPDLRKDAQKVLSQLVPVEREVRFGDHWFLGRLLPYRTAEDRIGGLVLTFIDITARKRSEQAVSESEARMRLAWEVDTVGILYFDANAGYTEVNAAFLQMSGIAREEVAQGRLPWDQLLPAGWTVEASESDEKPRAMTFEKEMQRKDGTRWWGLFTVARLSRKIIIEYVLDITESHRDREGLRESEERLRQLFSLVPAGIYTSDREGRIDFFNQQAVAMWGGQPRADDQFCGFKHVWDAAGNSFLLSDSPMVRAYRDGVSARNVELTVENHQGKRSSITINVDPIVGPDGQRVGAINVFQDVTERKASERALEEARQSLQDANKGLEQKITERTSKLAETIGELEAFSYTVAHDMRAPLRAMQAFASLLLAEYFSKLDENAQGYLNRIKTSADRLDRLIRDVLSYSRVVRQEWELEPVDSAKLLEEILQSYPHLQPPKVQVLVESPMPVLLANKAALTQVFSNLLSNAAKFVEPGRTPVIRVASQQSGSSAVISIVDNGIGIEKDAQKKIFEMFQQLDPGSYEGTGIGLSIVRKTVERMNGRVGLESAPGHGSRFWVELKIAPAT